jgi:predicted DNA-binding protein (UPF0251 family)/DNA-directed RNA polymerase subunit RPC12/RpoP
VRKLPDYHYFKPKGVPAFQLEEEMLSFEEFEALKLSKYDTTPDGKRLTQRECADMMDVSQPTFSRIIESALSKIAKAFVEGKAIVISGGKVNMENEDSISKAFHGYGCLQCEKEWETEERHDLCPSCKSPKIYKLIRKKGIK